MEKLNIISILYFNIVILWVVLPPLASGGACLLNHWTRGRIEYTPMDWLKCKLWSKECDPCEYYLFFHLLFPLVLLASTSLLMVHYPIATMLSVVGVLSFIFLPRYLCDIIHSLRFNFKKADSERLLELEEEIQKLKNK